MLANREGQRVPQVTFKTRKNGAWLEVSSAELFSGRTVVVFSLPGAFTPTCSSAHVPRYNELAQTFRANGVDEIICLSVNDAFVMNAWQQDQRAEHIRFLPDGNGEFSEAMGMLVGKQDLGFGPRSWRYSMLVRDGVIEKMFIEPDVDGDPFEVSDADTMLRYLNPEAKEPEFMTLFTKPGCSFCTRAKGLLAQHGVEYEEVVVGEDISLRGLRAVAGKTSTPQIFSGGKWIGGCDELAAYLG